VSQQEAVMKIVLATDFSDTAEHAQGHAVELARRLGAELVLLHIAVDAPLYVDAAGADARKVFETQLAWAEQTLASRAATLQQQGVPVRSVVRTGVAHEEIVAAAGDEHADMLVLGTHGRSGLDRLLLGSVTERVIRLASCPVLSVRKVA
jgi:nucleotide-binding universal stress UspA family protein